MCDFTVYNVQYNQSIPARVELLWIWVKVDISIDKSDQTDIPFDCIDWKDFQVMLRVFKGLSNRNYP